MIKAGIGIVMMLLGMSMCDSDNMIIPIVMLLIGMVLCLKGARDEEVKTHDYTGHDASYPSYLKR